MSFLTSTQTLPKILAVRSVAKSRLFEVEQVDLRFANGQMREYERLKGSSRAAVMVLPIEGEYLLMIREYSVGTEKYELGFVKGLMEENESMEQSANRELQEEIGFAARRMTFLRSLYTSPGYMQNLMHVIIAQDLFPSQLEGDEPEPLEIVRIPLAQIDDLLKQPQFGEARNLTALYSLRDYLKKS